MRFKFEGTVETGPQTQFSQFSLVLQFGLTYSVLTLKNLREGGQNDPLMFFLNNLRKEKDFSTKFWLMLEYDIKQ